MKVIVGQRVLCFLSAYAPKCGLSDAVKDLFSDHRYYSSHVVIGMASYAVQAQGTKRTPGANIEHV